MAAGVFPELIGSPTPASKTTLIVSTKKPVLSKARLCPESFQVVPGITQLLAKYPPCGVDMPPTGKRDAAAALN